MYVNHTNKNPRFMSKKHPAIVESHNKTQCCWQLSGGWQLTVLVMKLEAKCGEWSQSTPFLFAPSLFSSSVRPSQSVARTGQTRTNTKQPSAWSRTAWERSRATQTGFMRRGKRVHVRARKRQEAAIAFCTVLATASFSANISSRKEINIWGHAFPSERQASPAHRQHSTGDRDIFMRIDRVDCHWVLRAQSNDLKMDTFTFTVVLVAQWQLNIVYTVCVKNCWRISVVSLVFVKAKIS